MAWTGKYQQHNYMGEHASDADALTFIRGNKFDSTENGSGTAQNGMWFYDNVLHKYRGYINGAWTDISLDTTAIHKATSGEISALTEKTFPLPNDIVLAEDVSSSNAKRKIQLGLIPTPQVVTVGKKGSAGLISAGDVVALIAGAGDATYDVVELADANGTYPLAYGITLTMIGESTYGKICIFGKVTTTYDLSAGNEGDPVYLSQTAGQITLTQPSSGAGRTTAPIGRLIYPHATAPIIFFFGTARDVLSRGNNDYSNFTAAGTAYSTDKLLLENSSGTKQVVTLGAIPHTILDVIGSNSHLQIDSHIGNSIIHNPITTKGDLATFSSVAYRLPVGGTNGHVLTVNSAATAGINWAAPAATTAATYFFPQMANEASDTGYGYVQNISATGAGTLCTFRIPAGTISAIYLVCASASSAGNNTGDLLIETCWGGIDAAQNANAETDSYSGGDLVNVDFQTRYKLKKLNITDAFTNAVTDDLVSVKVTHSTSTGGAIDYYGIIVVMA